MMSEASFASLGPTLLARKGGAKPAMRPQLTPLTSNLSEMAAIADEQLEDLGWNDMGGENDDIAGEEALVLPAKRASSAEAAFGFNGTSPEDDDNEELETGPHPIIDPLAGAEVVELHASFARNQEAANEDVRGGESDPELETAKRAIANARKVKTSPLAQKGGRKASKKDTNARRAAFTLRLDTDRHLKLRLASTMQGISAQALVTEALDALLTNIEDLDTLVAQMKRDS
ncbi:MAG: hypothetical protein AAFW59_07345 [Pseudomonadota bacterium]